jgi:hypothetical protein
LCYGVDNMGISMAAAIIRDAGTHIQCNNCNTYSFPTHWLIANRPYAPAESEKKNTFAPAFPDYITL